MDLVNTEVVSYGHRHDLLAEPSHLIAWIDTLADAGYINYEQFRAPVAQWAVEALPELRSLRSFLRLQFERMADGVRAEEGWIAHLEAMIERAPFAYQWRKDRMLSVPVGAPEAALLSIIALNAMQLLASGQLQHVHRCGNIECVLLFIDSNPRRKWCSMKICGNRMKVTRHQKQKKQEQAKDI
ncbi:CGNR zinc finger domain-containing protein [Paenibacillus camelliae]|uniref:CGNR zinc finger domain-containing protein n=1 Tax=Paenibacillus camelliae TaxID=512410 RepID=UPI002041E3F4|nr:CGNR zinc finger domain-containing protein [Paenibacillus camelliae]MCM3634790.1 CGNR zinc finger domain-containing protein [Paenibacillus camelliae]